MRRSPGPRALGENRSSRLHLISWYDIGYTSGMKTAISIPDTVFEAAEELAKRLGKSRSQLYTEAIQALLKQRSDQWITDRLNEIYDAKPELAKMDPAYKALQYRSLAKEEW